MRGKLPVLWRRISVYFRHEFPEMAWPSSLPDPPGPGSPESSKPLPFREHRQVWAQAWHVYVAGWRAPRESSEAAGAAPGQGGTEEGMVGRRATPEGAPHVGGRGAGVDSGASNGRAKEEEEEAWSGDAQALVRRAVMARLNAYSDSLRQFLEGYKEGLQEDPPEPPSKNS